MPEGAARRDRFVIPSCPPASGRYGYAEQQSDAKTGSATSAFVEEKPPLLAFQPDQQKKQKFLLNIAEGKAYASKKTGGTGRLVHSRRYS
jgi:hypothetical protein